MKKISNMTPSELMEEMTEEQLDAVYRRVWSDHIYEDTIARIRDREINLEEETIEEIANAVADAWVYQGKYDCSTGTYWDNIDALIYKFRLEK